MVVETLPPPLIMTEMETFTFGKHLGDSVDLLSCAPRHHMANTACVCVLGKESRCVCVCVHVYLHVCVCAIVVPCCF